MIQRPNYLQRETESSSKEKSTEWAVHIRGSLRYGAEERRLFRETPYIDLDHIIESARKRPLVRLALVRSTKTPYFFSVTEQPSPQEVIENAQQRGARRRKDLVERSRPHFTVPEVARKLGISNKELQEKLDERELIYVETENGEARLPVWQLSGDQILPGLDVVLEELADYGWASDLIFFTSEHALLDGSTPAEALLKGQIDQVKHCASIQWRHGGS